jgi:hypothetical protein
MLSRHSMLFLLSCLHCALHRVVLSPLQQRLSWVLLLLLLGQLVFIAHATADEPDAAVELEDEQVTDARGFCLCDCRSLRRQNTFILRVHAR